VLVSQYDRAAQVSAWREGDPVDHQVSWLDFSFARDVSADGSRVVLSSSGQGSSLTYDVYVCGIDGSGATKIGEGQAQAFSPDGRSVLSILYGSPSRLVILPIGAGGQRNVSTGAVSPVAARWLHDGKRVLIVGAEPGQQQRAYVVDVAGGRPRPIAPAGVTFTADRVALAPDDSRVALRSPDGIVMLYPLDGGTPSEVRGLNGDEMPVDWTRDARRLVLQERSTNPRLIGLDPSTGAREPLLEVRPSDPGVTFGAVLPMHDGRGYVANYGRLQMTLFVGSNLR
jgi:hypothetical protein